MLDYSIKIGLIPEVRDLGDFETRKGIFEPAKGVERKNEAISYIKSKFTDDKTHFCDLEWLNNLGVVYKNSDSDKVCDYLKEEKVDAIFIINCNFGNEEVCGQIAKEMGVPVLLWGPQDTVFEENGQRYTDSQCGLFAISKQLRRYNVPFSYIENCEIRDKAFENGVRKFLSVVTMVKNFKRLNVVQVGTRLTPEDLNELKSKYDVCGLSDELLKKMLTFVYVYKEIFEETGASVLSSECWTSMPLAFGANPCLAMSILYDMGYIVTCESDVHGAITNALLMCAARGKYAPLFGEFTARHPENKNAELLWHCGPFPYSMREESSKPKLFNTKPSFRAKDGEYTIARFQGDGGKYTLLGGPFKTVDGPHTFGTYMWAEFKDWVKVEKKIINGPYIHHMSEIYGDYSEVLEEFCKYIDNLEYDPIEK